jgi:hypothetical protein
VVLAALAASQYGDMIVTTAAEVEELTNAQESASGHAIKR